MNALYVLLLGLVTLPQPTAAQQDSIRVFFLGRSEFGASGGIPAPFLEVCELAGVKCGAHRHWDFVDHDRSNGLPATYPGIARNRHVLRILATEEFHAVFLTFFAYNKEFYRPEPEYVAGVMDAWDDLYRLITVAGARLYVNEGYTTRENATDGNRISEGTDLLMARLDPIAGRAGTPPALRVPAGPFFNHMATVLGPGRWFADPLHASEFGQYVMARFFFACITGRSPLGFGHPPRITARDARLIDDGIVRFHARCPAQLSPRE